MPVLPDQPLKASARELKLERHIDGHVEKTAHSKSAMVSGEMEGMALQRLHRAPGHCKDRVCGHIPQLAIPLGLCQS